ncbi:MAG: DUF882 domain-containing protein [Alphaproteobacteria bacterium]|nr:DUF882 domain-containing protein [Alphaproteobacteria bacterium]
MKKALFLCLIFVLGACSFTRHPAAHNTPSPIMVGQGLEKTKPDPDARRRIVLAYPAAGERLDVVYFHDGRYDPDALRKINKLMRDRHTNTIGKIDPELIDFLVDIRKRFGLPETVSFQISSGYRSAQTNRGLARRNRNVAKESLHQHGWAVDFKVKGVSSKAICEIAKTMQRGGTAAYPDGHVHIDLGNIRTWKPRKR